MSEEIYPVSLEKTEARELRIGWSDGFEQTTSFRILRDHCQCATCMEKRKAEKEKEENKVPGALPILSAADTLPLEVNRMKPAGNYAYNIEFNDGHTTGLFTFELLRSLAELS